MLDLTNPDEAHVDQRLRENIILWLGSVRPDGRPHMVPVWFLWDGATILIFSQPSSQKIRNLRQNPRIVLALDDTDDGEDVITIEGTAELLAEPEITAGLPAYAAKYERHIRDIGLTPEAMALSYSQAIRITPTRFVELEASRAAKG
jgi:PPOX class probable F420-dependent enzyme